MILPLLIGLTLAGHQDSTLPRYTFAAGEEGWTVIQPTGDAAKVTAVHDPAHLKVGPGTLDFSYKVQVGQVGAALLAVGAGKLAGMKSIHFWIQSDHSSTIAINLQEKDGGRYTAMCHVTKGRWQEINLSLSDFSLATEPDAPKDPDGKLDPEAVEGMMIGDVDSFLVQNTAMSSAMGITAGPRHLYFSDFQFSDAKVSDTSFSGPDSYVFDNFSRPQCDWLGVGLTSMDLVTDSPFAGKWLKLDYHSASGHINGVARSVRVGSLAGKTKLVMELASTRECMLVVQLEETDGQKFNSIVTVPGMAKSTEVSVAISDFKISDDSPNKNGKQNLANVKQIVILDMSGMQGGADQDATLWLGAIMARA